jgi:flagellar motor switch protein FliG
MQNLGGNTLNPASDIATTLHPLQKAAILINSLEMRAADALLEQMPAEQAAKVREALLSLEDLPTEVQEAVIAEFLQSGGRLQAEELTDNDGVELHLSQTPPINAIARECAEAPLKFSAFHFLQDATPALLAEFLRQEHPQTVAVIIAQLDPDQAARVLERLPAELSTESLARMARLNQLSPEVVADLAAEIRLQLLPRIEAERRPHGLAGASAVLSALNDPLRKRMLGQLAHRDQSLVRQLGYLDGNQTPPRVAQPRIAATQAAKLTSIPTRAATAPQRAPALTFAELADLSDLALKKIFAHAEPQIVILALTGADERLVHRILKQLPTRDAAALRQRLNNPGPLRLRDMDAAQQALVAIAIDLHARYAIDVPQLDSAKHLSLQS